MMNKVNTGGKVQEYIDELEARVKEWKEYYRQAIDQRDEREKQVTELEQEAQLSDIAWTAVQEENERLRARVDKISEYLTKADVDNDRLNAALKYIGDPKNGSVDLASYARDSMDNV